MRETFWQYLGFILSPPHSYTFKAPSKFFSVKQQSKLTCTSNYDGKHANQELFKSANK